MPPIDLSMLHLSDAHLRLLQKILASCVPEAEVWAYGSRVTGKCHEGSDLDLVVRFSNSHTENASKMYLLKEALQESMLPILVDAHLWSQIPVSFHENIQAAYIVIQEGETATEKQLTND